MRPMRKNCLRLVMAGRPSVQVVFDALLVPATEKGR